MLEFLYSVWNHIEFISTIVNHVVLVFNTIFAVSTWFGKLIVDSLTKCLIGIHTSVYSILHGITIMCEDFTYFLSDIENIFSCTASVFYSACESVSSFLTSCVNMLYSIIYSIVYFKESICGVYRDGIKAVYDFLLTLKGALILIGNVIWTGITIIPALIIYLISLFVFFIHKSAEEIKTIISSMFYVFISLCSETYVFITDTPMESVCGLLVGLTLIYLTHKYKITIISVAANYFYKLSKSMQALLLTALVILLNIIHQFILNSKCVFHELKKTIVQLLKKNASPNSLNVSETNCPIERLCVVCKDNESNVVIMPCKHMCLCEDCSHYEVFRQYRRSSCPVCRQVIDKLLKVYL